MDMQIGTLPRIDSYELFVLFPLLCSRPGKSWKRRPTPSDSATWLSSSKFLKENVVAQLLHSDQAASKT